MFLLILGCLLGIPVGVIFSMLPGSNLLLLFSLGIQSELLIGIFATSSIVSKILQLASNQKNTELYKLGLTKVGARVAAETMLSGYSLVFGLSLVWVIGASFAKIDITINPLIGLIAITLLWISLIKESKTKRQALLVLALSSVIGYYVTTGQLVSQNVQALIFGMYAISWSTETLARKEAVTEVKQLDLHDGSINYQAANASLFSGFVGGLFAGFCGPNTTLVLGNSKENQKTNQLKKVIVTLEDRANYNALLANKPYQISFEQKQKNALSNIATSNYASGIANAISIAMLGLSLQNNPRSAEGMFMQLAGHNHISPIEIIVISISLMIAGYMTKELLLNQALNVYDTWHSNTTEKVLIALSGATLLPFMLNIQHIPTTISMIAIILCCIVLRIIVEKQTEESKINLAYGQEPVNNQMFLNGALSMPAFIAYASLI